MRNRCCYWAYLPANSPGEYAALGKVAEGEELGSNLLHVAQSNPGAQGGSPRSPEYGQIPSGAAGTRLRLRSSP